MTSIHRGFSPHSNDLSLDCAAWRLLITKFSHDLRTPMSAIANGCESLEKIGSKLLNTTEYDAADPDRLKQRILEMNDIVAIMSGTTAFLNMMINRCLDYTIVANGETLRPQIGEVDLRQAVLTAVNCVESLHSKNSIIVTDAHGNKLNSHTNSWKVLQSFGSLQADRQWLFEALLNLLSNAFKHGTNNLHSKENVHLMIGIEENGLVLRISVSDHGEEISLEQQRFLFSPPKISSTGGAGIGLFTMQQRLLVLGGDCGVASGVHGNTFWFTMPTGCNPSNTRTASPKSALASMNFELDTKIKEEYEQVYGSGKALTPVLSSHTLLSNTPLSSDKLSMLNTSSKEYLTEVHHRRSRSSSIVSNPFWRVLVVDDSLPSLKMTRRLLEGEGHIVTEALNGRAALQLLTETSEKRFDLVLMDLQMPGMDGFEATTALRHWENQQYDDVQSTLSAKSLLLNEEAEAEDFMLPKVKTNNSRANSRVNSRANSRASSPVLGRSSPGSSFSLPPLNANCGRSPAASTFSTSGKLVHPATFFSSGPNASFLSPIADRHGILVHQLPPLPPLTVSDRRSGGSGRNYSDTSTKNAIHYNSAKKHLVVGCSASTDPILLQEALFVGMDDFVSKPLTLAALSLLAKKHGLPY